MRTYKRVCIEDYTVSDKAGNSCSVERGKEYITSDSDGAIVTVFKEFWAPFPLDVFAGEKVFTK